MMKEMITCKTTYGRKERNNIITEPEPAILRWYGPNDHVDGEGV